MKFKYITIVFISVIFFNCNKQTNDIIEKDKLVDILIDLHIADAVLSDKGYYDGNLKDSTSSYYNYILKKHNVSRASFDNSIKYYNQNGEDYIALYEQVSSKISERVPINVTKESVYYYISKALKDSKILSNLNDYYGENGKEVWIMHKSGEFPKDSTKISLNYSHKIDYPCKLVFSCEIKINKKDSCGNILMKLDIENEDKSRQSDTAQIRYLKDWQKYQLIAQTDSLKKPKSFDFSISKCSNNKFPKLSIRNISLKQFAPDKK